MQGIGTCGCEPAAGASRRAARVDALRCGRARCPRGRLGWRSERCSGGLPRAGRARLRNRGGLRAVGFAITLAAWGLAGQDAYAQEVRHGAPVFLIDHGWHAGIVIDRADLSHDSALVQVLPQGGQFVEVGWGDAAYYRTREPGIWTAARGALWPTKSVLHVVAIPGQPADLFRTAEIIEIPCDREQAAAVGRFVAETFERSRTGLPIDEGAGLYGESRFYGARGRYHLLSNCNHWTARAVRCAGLPVRPAATPTVGALFRQVRAALDGRLRE